MKKSHDPLTNNTNKRKDKLKSYMKLRMAKFTADTRSLGYVLIYSLVPEAESEEVVDCVGMILEPVLFLQLLEGGNTERLQTNASYCYTIVSCWFRRITDKGTFRFNTQIEPLSHPMSTARK